MGKRARSPAARRRRQVRLDPAAAREIRAAVRWYEARDPAAATRFALAIDHAITAARIGMLGLVVAQPALAVPVHRILVRRFPYAIYYLSLDRAVRVLALAHQRRGAASWQRRLRSP